MCDSSVERVPQVGEVWRSTNRAAVAAKTAERIIVAVLPDHPYLVVVVGPEGEPWVCRVDRLTPPPPPPPAWVRPKIDAYRNAVGNVYSDQLEISWHPDNATADRMAGGERIGKVYANDPDRWVPCSGQEVLA